MEQVKNEKTFFEVFPTLRADGELKMLFQDVEVKKITTNSTREFLHIHMVSHHLIPKKVIWKMEQSIKEQLFGTASVAIQIEEFYVLSELCTEPQIWDAGGNPCTLPGAGGKSEPGI